VPLNTCLGMWIFLINVPFLSTAQIDYDKRSEKENWIHEECEKYVKITERKEEEEEGNF
jgi:hypothetical protein